MNIKPVCIEVNNFLSYHHEKMNLKDGLYFISGSNGAGKTSFFIESTTYCLYNKSMSGKKLSELCNKDNPKNMFVNILLNIDNEYHILVERGESPKRFNVYIETDENIDFKNKNKVKFNDSEYISFNSIVLKKVDNLAENVDTQEWLEEKFLKMNHTDFITYVLKSKARDLSYLEMTKADKDKYLENLFSLNTFRKMIDKVKIKMKDQEELSNISKNNYDNSQVELKHTIDKKESIIQIFEKQKAEKINDMRKSINELENNDSKSNEYNLIIKNCKNEKLSLDIDETIEFYDDKISKLNKKINDNKEQITNYETEYDNKINDEKVKQENVSVKISNLDNIYDEKKKSITERGLSLKSNIENLTKQISSIEYIIENAENEKQKYISVKNDEVHTLETEIEKQKEIYNNKVLLLKNKISELDVIDEILLNNNIIKINEGIKKGEIKLSKLESKTDSVNELINKFGITDREVLAEEIESFLLNDDSYENINNFLKNFNKTLSEINAENLAIENDISDVKDKISNLYTEQKKCQEKLKKLNILKNEKLEIQNQIDEMLEQFKNYEKCNTSDIKACKDEIIYLEKLYNSKIKELNIQLTNVRKEHNKCNEDIVELRNNLKNIDNEKENELSMLKLRLEKHSENIETFKTNKEKFINNLTAANKDIAKELVSIDIEKNDKINKLKNRISELDKLLDKNRELLLLRMEEITKVVKEYENKIIELENCDYSNNDEIISLDKQITELTKSVDFNYNKYTNDYNKFIIFDTIHKMLTKKNNIKLYIMEKFRNYLNKKLTHYSGEFKLPTTPLFDENFDILLNGENYEGLSLKSLSAGESAKLSLSVLFASMDVKKKMYNHGDFKMLLFDEILANIDINSIFDILKVLKEYSRDMFIGCIAHSVGDYLNDGTNITITKDNNGSHIQIA